MAKFGHVSFDFCFEFSNFKKMILLLHGTFREPNLTWILRCTRILRILSCSVIFALPGLPGLPCPNWRLDMRVTVALLAHVTADFENDKPYENL